MKTHSCVLPQQTIELAPGVYRKLRQAAQQDIQWARDDFKRHGEVDGGVYMGAHFNLRAGIEVDVLTVKDGIEGHIDQGLESWLLPLFSVSQTATLWQVLPRSKGSVRLGHARITGHAPDETLVQVYTLQQFYPHGFTHYGRSRFLPFLAVQRFKTNVSPVREYDFHHAIKLLTKDK